MKIGGVGGVKSRSESCLQVLCLDRRKVRVKWGSYRTPANTSQTGIPMSCSTSGHNSFLFFKKNTYLCVWLCQVLVAGCSMGDIVAWAGIEPGSPASWTWSLSHWTTRDVPNSPSWHPSSETAILPNTKLFLCSLFFVPSTFSLLPRCMFLKATLLRFWLPASLLRSSWLIVPTWSPS